MFAILDAANNSETDSLKGLLYFDEASVSIDFANDKIVGINRLEKQDLNNDLYIAPG